MELWESHVGRWDPRADKNERRLKEKETFRPAFLENALSKWLLSDKSQYLWVHGDEGTGKTKSVTALINIFDDDSNGSRFLGKLKKITRKASADGVLVYFLFQRYHSDFNTVTSVFQSLIYQLAKKCKLDWKTHGNSENVLDGPNAVFGLMNILQKILEDKSLPKVYLVIDAADECIDGQEYLMGFISKFIFGKIKTSKASWMVTSRQKGDSPWDIVDLNEESSTSASSERSSLLSSRGIVKPIVDSVDSIIKKGEYTREILRWTSISFRPLHVEELGAIISKETESVRDLVKECFPLLIEKDMTVYFNYSPARTYLFDDQNRASHSLALKEKDHWSFMINCIEIMEESFSKLKISSKDTMRPKQPDGQKHPRGIEYACFHWVNHLTEGSRATEQEKEADDSMNNFSTIASFLKNHFLDWFRVLLEMRTPVACIQMLNHLYFAVGKRRPDFRELIEDARRFALSNRSLVEGNPLQLYDSARMFAPRMSLIKDQSHSDKNSESSEWIRPTSGIPEDWSPCSCTLEGHSSWVTSVVFSPDGKLVASASTDNTIKIWDALTGTICATLEGHLRPINSVAFSPDGQYLASASNDRTVKLWRVSTAAEAIPSERLDLGCYHSESVNSVVFSEDGKWLVSASNDTAINIWNATNLDHQYNLTGHSAPVRQIAFSQRGQELASASDDGTVNIWQIPGSRSDSKISSSGKPSPTKVSPRHTLAGHDGPVNTVAFSPNGKWLASGSEDGTIKLWSLPDYEEQKGKIVNLPWGSTSVYSVAFIPVADDDQILAIASNTETVILWDVDHDREFGRLKGHQDWVRDVSISRYGQIASASNDGTVKLWDTQMARLRHRFDEHSGPVNDIAFSPAAPPYIYATASDDHTVKLWRIDTGAVDITTTLQGHSDAVNRVIFSPDGNFVASSSDDKTIRLWNMDAINQENARRRAPPITKSYRNLEYHEKAAMPIAFSPDGRILASGSRDKKVVLWNTETGEVVKVIEHQGEVRAISFSHEQDVANKVLGCSTSTAGEMKMWTTEGELSNFIDDDFRDWIRDVTFTRDGKLLAWASDNKNVYIYRTENVGNDEYQPRPLYGHTDWIRTVSFSDDGKLLASGSDDSNVILRNTVDFSERVFTQHSGAVNSVNFLPGSQLVVSASDDQTVKVWDASTLDIVHDLTGHLSWVKAAIPSPDGSKIVSISGDPDVKTWEMETGKELFTARKQFGRVNIVRISPDKRYIATVSEDDTDIRLWDQRGKPLMTLRGNEFPVQEIWFSQDGSELIASLDNMGLTLWRTKDGAMIDDGSLNRHSDVINHVLFLSSGQKLKTIASCSDDTTIRLWNTKLQLSFIIGSHKGPVKSIASSPNGRLLASASDDCTVKIWDLDKDDYPRIQDFKHRTEVKLVSFLDDNRVASVSEDLKVTVWSVKSQKEEFVYERHTNPVTAIAHSIEKNLLATADSKDIHIWRFKRTRPEETHAHIGPTRTISFDVSNGCVSTDRGHIELKSLFATSKEKLLYDPFYVRDTTIQVGKDEVLQLPSQYEPTSVAVSDNIIALGQNDGKILVLEVHNHGGVESQPSHIVPNST